MRTLLQTFTNRMRLGRIPLVCLFVFAACMDSNDEVVVPDEKADALSSKDQSSVRQMQNNFTAHLSGSGEVPAVETNATGQAIFKLSDDGTELHYKLIVANIENVTQSHIHCGPAGVNGPVVVFLFGFDAEGVSSSGILGEGTITSANIIARPDSEACMGGLATFEQLLEKMRSGEAYVNVHTIANPPGEIRGQIK